MSEFSVPYSFTAGTKAKASEVNANFTACKTAIGNNTRDIEGINTSLESAIVKDGSLKFENLQSYRKRNINLVTNASPIVITSTSHGFSTGNLVYISEIEGTTSANGKWTITKITADTFSLDGSVGNAAYTSGGCIYLLPSSNENIGSKIYIDSSLNSYLPQNYIDGLGISYTTTSVTIAAGICADSTNTFKISLSTALIKLLSSNWAEGTNTGGLDTGSKAISTTYYVFVIAKNNGNSDVLFSLSSTNPTMPAGYLYKKMIGSVTTDSSGDIARHSMLSSRLTVVESYVNGTSWYRVWSDGWIEQGGQLSTLNTTTATLTFLKSFKTLNYSCFANENSSATASSYEERLLFYSKTNSSCTYKSMNANTVTWAWEAKGY